MTPPIVSIILPTFNDLLYIETTMRTVCAQSFTNFELIIVDDGSTDETPIRLRSLVSSDTRLRYVRNQHAGLGQARNTGLDQARGRFIAFVDAGDLLAPAFLYTLVNCAEKTQADVVMCNIQRFADGQPCPFDTRSEHRELNDAQQALRALLCDEIPPEIGNRLYRRETLGALRFIPGLGIREDLEYSVRILLSAQRVCRVDQPLYGLRQRAPLTQSVHRPPFIEARMRVALLIKDSLREAEQWDVLRPAFQTMAVRHVGYEGFQDLIRAPSINWQLYDRLLLTLRDGAEIGLRDFSRLTLDSILRKWVGVALIHPKLGRWFLNYQFRRLHRARKNQSDL